MLFRVKSGHDNTLTVHVQVARCTKIINPGTEDAKYVINVKQIAKVCLQSLECASVPNTANMTSYSILKCVSI